MDTPPVLEAWEDCERDYGAQHNWRWSNFQNFDLGAQECSRCSATRRITDRESLEHGRGEIESLGGRL